MVPGSDGRPVAYRGHGDTRHSAAETAVKAPDNASERTVARSASWIARPPLNAVSGL
jgi:hypothetical protein